MGPEIKKSNLVYSYNTIRLTKSRLEKGLLALPKSIANLFPENSQDINILFGESNRSFKKKFSSYSSTTRECRIGGMAKWFRENQLDNGDEIVLQVINKNENLYRVIPEKMFVNKICELENDFDKSTTENEADELLSNIGNWAHGTRENIIINEYGRLILKSETNPRKRYEQGTRMTKEATPSNIRLLLGELYKGHCQVCDFWFLKRDHLPYYEIHHLNSSMGSNPKNLLLVCANCHNQFEYSTINMQFDKTGWLSRVRFNERQFDVNQITHNIAFNRPLKKTFDIIL
jgi:predicted metal-binding protein